MILVLSLRILKRAHNNIVATIIFESPAPTLGGGDAATELIGSDGQKRSTPRRPSGAIRRPCPARFHCPLSQHFGV